MGGAHSQLEETKKLLQQEQARSSQLAAELAQKTSTVHKQAKELVQRDADLAAAANECEQRLDAKSEELAKAVKQRELAEDLRRSDAVLIKRVMSSVLRKREEGQPLPGGVDAIQATLAASSELQLRQVVQGTAIRLAEVEAQKLALQKSHEADLRRELCESLWLPKLCDVSLALRHSHLMVLGGIKMPRSRPPASGLSGGVGVLRRFGGHFGDASISQGEWAAIGGSMLWDSSKAELAAVRFAMCVQPAPTQQLCASFDHRGKLNGSVKATLADALSVRFNWEVDVNRKEAPTAGVEFFYDLD